MQLSVRNVNKEIFKEFKTQAIREGLAIGKAVNIALETWTEKEKGRKKSFEELKPVDWGKGTEKSSKEIDKALYGD